MIYLASPYTSEDKDEQRMRYYQACRAAAKLMEQGHVVFSPIAHSHGIARFIESHDHDFWMKQDLEFLHYADELIILTLPGWKESKGVLHEIRVAAKWGLPIEYMEAP